MMSSDTNTTPSKRAASDDSKGSGGGGGGGKRANLKPPEQGLKCPRCDSSNTKFCYYNNYNFTQPRHFCKTCRRYWTKGGALRNVPIGGSCRKNKKIMKSNTSRVVLSGSDHSKDSINLCASESSSLKFYNNGFSHPAAMDFQLGNCLPNFPITGVNFNQFASAAAPVNPSSLVGFNYPVVLSSSVLRDQEDQSGGFNGRIHEMGGSVLNLMNSGLASSIESLSCINQDMHLKLQEQRRLGGVVFGDQENQKGSSTVRTILEEEDHHRTSSKPQPPISFQNINSEISKPGPNCAVSTDHPRTDYWFFESSCNPTNSTVSTTAMITNYNSKGGDGNASNWTGIQAWTDLNQYSTAAFP